MREHVADQVPQNIPTFIFGINKYKYFVHMGKWLCFGELGGHMFSSSHFEVSETSISEYFKYGSVLLKAVILSNTRVSHTRQ